LGRKRRGTQIGREDILKFPARKSVCELKGSFFGGEIRLNKKFNKKSLFP